MSPLPSDSSVGSLVSDVAASKTMLDETDGDPVEFGSYLSTDEEDFLAHMHEHDHDGDHAHEHNEGTTEEIIEVFADARGGKGGGSNKTTDSGGGGRGKGKTKDSTDSGGATEEPEPTPELQPEPVLAPDPEPTPQPEPQSEPILSPDEFGWLTSSNYLSGGDTPDGFNVELVFYGSSWTSAQKEAAAEQAEILSNIITGDLPSYGDIDDVRIQMYNENIDGASGVWGRGGWINLRSDGMVAEGGVRVDINDIGTAESWNMMDELFMHEMLHAIGFGTTWSREGLISNGEFIGANAIDVYGSAVPLNGNGHLDESVGNEIGTTHITNNAEPITDLTLAILEDMGYETLYDSNAYV